MHWVDGKRTGTASAVLTGLTPGTRVSFLVREFFRGVTGDWSDPITQIVGWREAHGTRLLKCRERPEEYQECRNV